MRFTYQKSLIQLLNEEWVIGKQEGRKREQLGAIALREGSGGLD